MGHQHCRAVVAADTDTSVPPTHDPRLRGDLHDSVILPHRVHVRLDVDRVDRDGGRPHSRAVHRLVGRRCTACDEERREPEDQEEQACSDRAAAPKDV
jgi:hypothetical protein